MRRNSEQADQWQRRTYELTEQGQVTDRYTKAIEQLGSYNRLDVRIGGIYALERVARDSARDHPTVMEVLAAFIREHSRETWRVPESATSGGRVDAFPRPDVQAALTVIGRRDAGRDQQAMDLTAAVLPRALLFGADLTCVRLVGAVLSHAVVHSGAKLIDADLRNADLTEADLNGADLTRADLGGAILVGADLTGADLQGARLIGANCAAARWPEGAPVPEGWKLDRGSGRLERADNDPAANQSSGSSE